MRQRWVRRSSSAVVIFASPKALVPLRKPCVDASRCARKILTLSARDRVRSCVRPLCADFHTPRAGREMRGSGPNQLKRAHVDALSAIATSRRALRASIFSKPRPLHGSRRPAQPTTAIAPTMRKRRISHWPILMSCPRSACRPSISAMAPDQAMPQNHARSESIPSRARRSRSAAEHAPSSRPVRAVDRRPMPRHDHGLPAQRHLRKRRDGDLCPQPRSANCPFADAPGLWLAPRRGAAWGRRISGGWRRQPDRLPGCHPVVRSGPRRLHGSGLRANHDRGLDLIATAARADHAIWTYHVLDARALRQCAEPPHTKELKMDRLSLFAAMIAATLVSGVLIILFMSLG